MELNLEQLFRAHRVCAILRHVAPEDTVPYALAAWAGGVRLFEVALNSPHALEQLALLRERLPEDAYLGAGTVLTPGDAEAARTAGARFLLTPAASEPVLEYCREEKIPLLPGVMTPTDVALCLQYGFRTLKLFPAGCLPPDFVKALRGPFDGTQYVAVGGVTPENLGEFLQRGFLGAGLGNNLFPREAVKSRDWEACRRAAERQFK